VIDQRAKVDAFRPSLIFFHERVEGLHVLLTMFISLAIAIVCGLVLLSGGLFGADRALDVVFGLSVALFVGSLVALIIRHALATLRIPEERGEDTNSLLP